MGCSSCSNSGGLPNGCKNNGACGVSGCNKLDVFDWLAGMELPVGQKPYDVVEVRFKNGRKSFYRNTERLELHIGDVIAVESSPGHDIGIVSLTGELVKTQLSVKGAKDDHELKKVYRKAKEEDVDKWQAARALEMETMHGARKIASDLGLMMKISDVEYQGDGAKATFFYTAEDRVDFRELIKNLSNSFKVRVEMRQIGMRQEAARLGGIGSCGRELCCSTWLTDFRSVSTSAARYQQLSLNPQKLAGQCGKLKCCLNYELDQYMEAVKHFPKGNIKLQTEVGIAFHFKTDIFKNLMYFIQPNQPGASPVAISVDDVKEVIAMNEKGEKPMSLMDFKIEEFELVEETTYDNVVGQDSLTRFDTKKKRKSKRGGNSKQSPRNQKSTKPVRSGNPPKGKPTPKGKPSGGPSKGPQKPVAKKEGESPKPKSKPKRKPNPARKPKGDQPKGDQPKGGQTNGPSKPGNKPAE